MRRLRLFSLAAIVATVGFVACKDDFNEEDFLKLQNELALGADSVKRIQAFKDAGAESEIAANSYIAALNEAGDLMSVTVLVREDEKPLAGVTVTITGSGTATTDAAGNAVFDRVKIGSSSISFTKAGYIPATALVSSGVPGAPFAISVGGTIRYSAPAKRNEHLTVNMFSTSPTDGSTAVVTGKVTIETDLTNLTPEIPQNLVLKADLSAITAFSSSPATFAVSSFLLANGSGLAEATVDNTTGMYSMRVPATEAGIPSLKILLPTITGTQKIAVNGIDDGTGAAVAITTGPELRDVSTQWGTGLTYEAIPIVLGAKVTFAAPPAAGRGFTFDMTAYPRALETGDFSSSVSEIQGNTTYKISSRGAGYVGAPTVAITGGGGTGAVAKAFLRGLINSVEITSAGAGYTNAGTYTIEFTYVDKDGNTQDLGLNDIDVTASATGTLPLGALTLPNFDGFKGDNTPFETENEIQSIGFRVLTNGNATPTTAATITADKTLELGGIEITNGGSGFTTKPTFALTAGGATTQGTVEVLDFATQWNLVANNVGNTVDYAVLPSKIQFSYPATSVATATTNEKVNLISTLGVVESSNLDVIGQLKASGGDILLNNSSVSLRTNTAWSVKPTVLITDDAPSMNKVSGAPSSITITAAPEGKITAITVASGNGYNAPVQPVITPTIAGLPGTGAEFLANYTYSTTTGEYTFTSLTSINPGSGYLQNANRKGTLSAAPAVPTIPSAQTGKTYVVNIDYGTGDKLVVVN